MSVLTVYLRCRAGKMGSVSTVSVSFISLSLNIVWRCSEIVDLFLRCISALAIISLASLYDEKAYRYVFCSYQEPIDIKGRKPPLSCLAVATFHVVKMVSNRCRQRWHQMALESSVTSASGLENYPLSASKNTKKVERISTSCANTDLLKRFWMSSLSASLCV